MSIGMVKHNFTLAYLLVVALSLAWSLELLHSSSSLMEG